MQAVSVLAPPVLKRGESTLSSFLWRNTSINKMQADSTVLLVKIIKILSRVSI